MADMAEYLQTSERKVRLIAEKIKKENLQNARLGWILISGNFGYKISKNINEIKDYVKRQKNMAISLLEQSSQAERYIKHLESEKTSIL